MKKDIFFKTSAYEFPVTIITGVRRSGKSLLGNILATCEEAEYSEEPYPIMSLPIAIEKGEMNIDFASKLLNSYVVQLFIESILLRNANFRYNDLSSIWTKKTPEKIFNRMANVNTTAQAWNYIRSHNSSLVMTLPESMSFVDIWHQTIPRTKYIHVVRNGFDVASDVAKKLWFVNEKFKNPEVTDCYRLYNNKEKWYFPWWVGEGDEEKFLNYSNYEKGLYYWLSLQESSKIELLDNKKVLIVDYDKIVANPNDECKKVFDFLGLRQSELTQIQVDKTKVQVKQKKIKNIDNELKKSVEEMNVKLGVKNAN